MSRKEREMWIRTIDRIVKSNKDFLIYIGSEQRSETAYLRS